MNVILIFILEIKLLSFHLMMRLFISVNQIRIFRKVSEKNKTNMVEIFNNLETIGENKKVFRKRQYKIASVKRNVYHMVGAQTMQNFKIIISQNIIQNCPVTVEDIEIVKKIFGCDVSTLKERTTGHRP